MKSAILRLNVLWCALAVLCAAVPSFASNAVGYVNVTLVPGFNLVSNPLHNQTGNTIQNILGPGIQNIPDGLTVYLLDEAGQFETAQYDSSIGSFQPPEVAEKELTLGRGFFIYNPSTTNVTAVFVGEVMWGMQYVPSGFSMQGSVVPIAGTFRELHFPGSNGDRIYLWDPIRQQFRMSVFDDLDGAWMPDFRLQVAEGFIVFKQEAAEWFQPNPLIPPAPAQQGESAFFLIR